MACLLLLQAAFGICCHVPEVCGASADRLQLINSCCERCAPASPDDATPLGPTGPAKACRGFCTYVKADTTNVDASDLAPFAFIAPSIEAAPSSVNLLPRRNLANSCNRSYPVRLHMLYQIILI